MDEILSKLNLSGGFKIKDIRILKNADEFFQVLCHKIKAAEKVFISCLSIDGIGRGRIFLDIIEQRLKLNMQTTIFLDKSRSFRDRYLMDDLNRRNMINSITFIDKMVSKLLPYIVNESISVYHDKIYVFDDELILSGANIGGIYLSDRVDRFWLIKDRNFVTSMVLKIFNQNIQLGLPSFASKDSHFKTKTLLFDFSNLNEKNTIQTLFKLSYKRVFICTPYMNFPKTHLEVLKQVPLSIVTSGPQSRRFKNFGFFGKIINDIYKYSRLKTQEYLPNSMIYEYSNKGHTFHAKGIWLFSEGFAINIIGSSNFNNRSANLDSELSWIAVSNDMQLIKLWEAEVERIQKFSQLQELKLVDYKTIPFYCKFLFWIFNKFL